jgi:hypothetical protein
VRAFRPYDPVRTLGSAGGPLDDRLLPGNLFDRGQGTDGGEFPAYGGNVWSDNWWADGVLASSGQSR